MKKRFAFVLTAATVLIGITGISKSARAISITPTNDGNTLVNTILGSGITVVPGSVNYTGASGASGIFTNGNSSGIGINSGIILTTGQASDAVGPNNLDNTTTGNGTPGDADLNALIPQNTNDAATLEFDFESAGGNIFFNYVFASEEYNEFVNSSFNDVFAFFLDGQNIALIPGTTTPVSINNVNGGNPLGNNASNSQFYVNNDPSDGGPFFDIEYDGFTKVFTAQALGLTPGKHTIKLAIADAGDSILDSAVFIQGSSFSDTPPEEIPEPMTILGTLTAGAFGTQFMRKRKQMQAAKSEA
ncbi:MAG: PEP-CTERM sorting domain-containing protein [Richelia sp. SL_2_1]|nr:PEP-CTERM sorting domain-containing protein [Richelia sp. SM1_7_0]NJO31357.1 PEP-CTERM sorting domain-containing protein [Richelia sp. SL_2_1]